MVIVNKEYLLNKYGDELYKLSTIKLSHEKITQIDPNTFKELYNLESLFINFNKLINLDSELFNDLKKFKNTLSK